MHTQTAVQMGYFYFCESNSTLTTDASCGKVFSRTQESKVTNKLLCIFFSILSSLYPASYQKQNEHSTVGDYPFIINIDYNGHSNRSGQLSTTSQQCEGDLNRSGTRKGFILISHEDTRPLPLRIQSSLDGNSKLQIQVAIFVLFNHPRCSKAKF